MVSQQRHSRFLSHIQLSFLLLVLSVLIGGRGDLVLLVEGKSDGSFNSPSSSNSASSNGENQYVPNSSSSNYEWSTPIDDNRLTSTTSSLNSNNNNDDTRQQDRSTGSSNSSNGSGIEIVILFLAVLAVAFVIFYAWVRNKHNMEDQQSSDESGMSKAAPPTVADATMAKEVGEGDTENEMGDDGHSEESEADDMSVASTTPSDAHDIESGNVQEEGTPPEHQGQDVTNTDGAFLSSLSSHTDWIAKPFRQCF